MGEPDPDDAAGRPKKLMKFINNGILPPEATLENLKGLILSKYDGYSWDGKVRLLNPWSVFNAFGKNRLGDFWLRSGAPKFLSELAEKDWRVHEIFRMDSYLDETLNDIDIGDMSPAALLFQTGYLTVDRREAVSGDFRYYLRFPNLEVEAAIFKLTLGLEEPIKLLPQLRENAKALLAALAGLDPSGFQKAFETILASLPYVTHTPYEGHYQAILLLTLGSVGQRYESESQSGDGVFDVSLQTAQGDAFVIELKYVSRKDPNGGKDLPDDRLKAKMGDRATEALAQIEEKKYARKFQGAANNVYKMALVIGGYTDVLAVFEKADNWRLVKRPDGSYRVEET
jgi:hypothetical protein